MLADGTEAYVRFAVQNRQGQFCKGFKYHYHLSDFDRAIMYPGWDSRVPEQHTASDAQCTSRKKRFSQCCHKPVKILAVIESACFQAIPEDDVLRWLQSIIDNSEQIGDAARQEGDRFGDETVPVRIKPRFYEPFIFVD